MLGMLRRHGFFITIISLGISCIGMSEKEIEKKIKKLKKEEKQIKNKMIKTSLVGLFVGTFNETPQPIKKAKEEKANCLKKLDETNKKIYTYERQRRLVRVNSAPRLEDISLSSELKHVTLKVNQKRLSSLDLLSKSS